MGKSRYFFFIPLVLLLAGGVFAYYWWQQNYRSSAWPFIPDHAVLVIETENPMQVLQDWQEEKIASHFKQLPYFRRLLLRRDTLLRSDEKSEDFFKGKKVLTSLHVTARDNFDYMFFIPLRSGEEELVNRMAVKFDANAQYTFAKRNFQGQLIYEISPARSGTIFSYILYEQHVIGSYTPFLVEDAIRTINELPSLQKSTWTKISEQSGGDASDLQLYIQPEALPRLMQVFAGEQISLRFPLLGSYAQSSHLNVKAEGDNLLLSGISTVDKKGEADYLSIFSGQTTQPLQCMSLIPANTALLYHWGFGDAGKLASSLKSYWQEHEKLTLEKQEKLSIEYKIVPEEIFGWMKEEMALAVLESNHKETRQLLFIQAVDIDNAMDHLNGVATAIEKKESMPPYTESYSDVAIHQIQFEDFPEAILGSAFKGFEQCFYAPVNGYIVFSNNIQNIKQLLDDIKSEQVWSHSVRNKALIKLSEEKDNFGLFIHTARAWHLFHKNASPKWKKLMQSYSSVLKKMEYASLQMSFERGQTFRTHVFVKFDNEQTAQHLQNKFFVNTTTRLDNALSSPAFVVRNHIDRSREILVQDASKQLYLINAKGKVIWKKSLNAAIVSPVTQIDFYKNNKLQYLFATSSWICILDRNGNPIEKFPITMPDTAHLHTLSAIDYDNNRDYRIMASDTRGNLYLYNKNGTLLDEWNPLHLGYRLSSPVTHIRIRGKDYIIALQANGTLQVLNRKGKVYPGFPLHLGTRVSNPLFVEPAIEPGDTRITVMTDNGEMVTSNLLGKIVERQQFYRPSRDAVFKLCMEATNKNWLVARYTDNKVALLDKDEKTLFEKEYISSDKPMVQYYDFGADVQLIAITHLEARKTYLYDIRGKAVGTEPIANNQPVSMLYVENYDKLLIYRAGKQETSLLSVKIR